MQDLTNIEAAMELVRVLGPKPMLLKFEHDLYREACATLTKFLAPLSPGLSSPVVHPAFFMAPGCNCATVEQHQRDKIA